ncbi:MAG TPA: M10 family metallopeptidase C-terminal domain-containing protein [Allosphingosinicella sp.]
MARLYAREGGELIAGSTMVDGQRRPIATRTANGRFGPIRDETGRAEEIEWVRGELFSSIGVGIRASHETSPGQDFFWISPDAAVEALPLDQDAAVPASSPRQGQAGPYAWDGSEAGATAAPTVADDHDHDHDAMSHFGDSAAPAAGSAPVGPTDSTRTGNLYIDGVLSGTQWDTRSLTYSFPTSRTDYEDSYPFPGGVFEAFNPDQQAAVRQVFGNISAVSGLAFTEVTGGEGVLRFGEGVMPAGAAAYAYYPSTSSAGGDSWYGQERFNSPSRGDYAFKVFIHEIGHALGLKHPHDGGRFGDEPGNVMPADADWLAYTVMSYSSIPGSPSYATEPGGYPQSLMMYDIAALQHMYGANYQVNAGDTVYRWGPDGGRMWVDGVVETLSAANRIFLTVWDGGGTDTYDFSAYSSDLVVSLEPGEWTTTDRAQLANLAWANGATFLAPGNIANALLFQGDTRSMIENATGGSGNDRIAGNAGANLLGGGGGADILAGGGGSDILDGGLGADIFVYSLASDSTDSARDRIRGFETGLDRIDLTDLPAEAVSWSELTDSQDGSLYNLVAVTLVGAMMSIRVDGLLNLADFVMARLGTGGDDQLTGTDGDDAIHGSGGADQISGLDGQDRLHGGDGNDLLDGGSGNDVVRGESGDDRLAGGAGPDTLDGGAGDDILEGGLDDDTLRGGQGNDILKISETGKESAQGGEGRDTLVIDWSSATTNIEGYFPGSDPVNGYSGSVGDLGARRVDYSGIERLVVTTGSGRDLITGGANDDVVSLGAGDDIFSAWIVGGDIADGGAGVDGLSAEFNNLPASISWNLQTGAFSGAAGSFVNFEYFSNLTTGSGGDTIVTTNAAREEWIFLGSGDDSLTVLNGLDHAYGQNGVDTLVVDYRGSTSANRLTVTGPGAHDGFSGSSTVSSTRMVEFDSFETLHLRQFRSGTDKVDLTSLRVGSIQLTEQTDSSGAPYSVALIATSTGTLSIRADGRMTLTDFILAVSGTDGDDLLEGTNAADVVSGFAGNDQLRGLDGPDRLNGGDGDDWLDGGLGNDNVNGDSGNDTLRFTDLGRDVADGGMGVDTLAIDWGAATNAINPLTIITPSFPYGDTRNYSGTIASANNDRRVDYSAIERFVINTGSGNDRIWTGSFDDVVNLGAGNDFLDAYTGGADIVDAGAGLDGLALNLSASGAAILWDLRTGSFNGLGRYANFEYFTELATGSGNDAIVTSSLVASDVVRLGPGDDIVTLLDGADRAFGEAGADTLVVDHRGAAGPFELKLLGGAAGGGFTGLATSAVGRSVEFDSFETLVIRQFRSGSDRINLNSLTVSELSWTEATDPESASIFSLVRVVTPGGILSIRVDGQVAMSDFRLARLGTEGDDDLAGSADDDVLRGFGGNDQLSGLAGHDRIDGGEGHDTLDGGLGNDLLNGENGNDVLKASGAGTDSAAGGQGMDTLSIDWSDVNAAVYGSASGGSLASGFDGSFEAHGRKLTYSGIERFILTTGSSFDLIRSGASSDVIDLGAGDDQFSASEANDIVEGGPGTDGIEIDFAASTEAISWNLSTAIFSGGGRYTGFEFFTRLTTGSGNDIIVTTADRAADILALGAGDDSVTLFDGWDRAFADSGSDTLVVDYSGSTANVQGSIYYQSAGGGVTGGFYDYSGRSVDFDSFEKLVVTTGSGNDLLDLTRGQSDDIVSLGAGDDFVSLRQGSDRADGGSGIDGLSADLSAVGADIRIDLGANIYVVPAAWNFANFEYLGWGSDYFRTGAGNDIVATAAVNRSDMLDTGAGDDRATFRDGFDSFAAGAGTDILVVDYSAATHAIRAIVGPGDSDNDGDFDGEFGDGGTRRITYFDVERFHVIGGAAADSIATAAGDDVLDGGPGADSLAGGRGNDVYIVDSLDDVVVENDGEGTDEVRTSLAAYVLAPNVEKLTATSDVAQDLRGNAGDNGLAGGGGGDFIRLHDGGNDAANGGEGNDVFLFGAALDGADQVNGGSGTDQIAIQGDYAGAEALTLGSSIVSIENFAILPGNDMRFGDPGTNFYDYELTFQDLAVAAGVQLVVDANRLRVGEDFTFNGSAETDGSFFIYGGSGVDTLTGGARNDVFIFGHQGQWGAGDIVTGGAGVDQLALRGNYTIVFGAGQLNGIEQIGMVSAQDTRYGALGSSYSYDLTMADSNVAGIQMTVDAAPLKPGETLTFDGSAEDDGSFRLFGGRGDDRLAGSQNGDILTGNGGADQLAGGAGGDAFRYVAASDSAPGSADRILDFTPGTDWIDLSRIDADTHAAGNQAFRWIGSNGFTGTDAASAGELRAYQSGNSWFVEGDTDGNGAADFVIEVVTPAPLAADHFLL